jgi:hypothetical protein
MSKFKGIEMNITKLPDRWRDAAQRVNLRGQIFDTCATELEAALPQWTRITGDHEASLIIGEAYWCDCLEDFNQICIFTGSETVDGESAHWFQSQITDRYVCVNSCRPLCDLDYPPGNEDE